MARWLLARAGRTAPVGSILSALLLFWAACARRRKKLLEAALSGTLHADGTLEVDEAGPRPAVGVSPTEVPARARRTPPKRAPGTFVLEPRDGRTPP